MYMTPDAIKIPPAKRWGWSSRAALRDMTTVVKVDEYAPPRKAASTIPPRPLVTFCRM